MPNPICCLCQIEMKPQNNGAYVAEMFRGNDIYKIWCADIWECPICERRIVIGFGRNPVAEHFNKEEMEFYSPKVEYKAFEKASEALVFGDKKEFDRLKEGGQL